jgi:putative FmdB family regulatory protein
MPLYEYKCSKCDRTFEKMQKFSDPPLTSCNCGENGAVQRLISPPAFHLKGGGWYKDGYGSGKSGGNGDSQKSASTTADSKAADSKPADSKPEAKASETKSSESKPASSTGTGS